MNGNYFLDTNAIIQLLQGNREIYDILSGASFIACSVISELEYRSFPDISDKDLLLLDRFLLRISVVDVNHANSALKDKISQIRKSRKVKLPDAIILASAKTNNCLLVTADKGLQNLSEFADICAFNPIK